MTRLWKKWSLLLVVAGLGCANSVVPEAPSGNGFAFFPANPVQKIGAGEFLEFTVTHSPEPDLGVRWWVNGEPSGVGPRFRFFPSTTRIDTLTADASRAGRSAQYSWYIDSMYDSPTAVSFLPGEDVIDVVLGRTYTFSAASSRAAATIYRWEFGGETLGSEPEFVFAPGKSGTGELQATVTTPDRPVRRTWQIRAYTAENLPPAPPTALQYQVLQGIANLVVSWQQAVDRGVSVASYQLAISYDGPITNDNWAAAKVLLERPYVPGQAAYIDTLSAENGLLEPGEHAWLAATSINLTGVRSTVSNNFEVDITEPWWITGVVRDETGRTLPNVRIWDAGHHLSVLSGPDGRYRIGPFPNTRQVWLETESPNPGVPGNTDGSWADARSDTLAMGVRQEWDFLLLSDIELESDCAAYGGGFIKFLRESTLTMHPTRNRPNLNLYKWETYPVPIWIPEFTNGNGVDFGSLCRETVRIWNTAMGEDFLTIAADSVGSGITFRYGDDIPGFMGRAILVEDEFTGRGLGDVIPRNVELYLLEDISTTQLATEVALHELGHALGLYGHLSCADQGYLMDISPTGALDGGEAGAIHPDEIRALRAVRDLPQGTDMGQYLTDLW